MAMAMARATGLTSCCGIASGRKRSCLATWLPPSVGFSHESGTTGVVATRRVPLVWSSVAAGVRGRSGEENRNYDTESGIGRRVPTWMLVVLAFIVGIAVGLAVGFIVGTVVGFIVGVTVGLIVGFAVGGQVSVRSFQ